MQCNKHFDAQSITSLTNLVHGKNDFIEGFKILLNTHLKIILLDHQNNFVEILKISNIVKNFDILAISLS